MASGDVDAGISGKNCVLFGSDPGDDGFEKLFRTYAFNAVIFFSSRPEEPEGSFRDLEQLETVLKLCANHDVDKVIFVSSTVVYEGLTNVDETTVPMPTSKMGLLLYSCEQLCDIYRKKHGISVVVLRPPSLFGYYESKSIIGNIVLQIATKNFVQFYGIEEQLIDFLSLEDFGELVVRILYDWQHNISVINVPGARKKTFAQLGRGLYRVVHTTRIAFSGKPAHVYPPVQSNIARKAFDWTPIIDIDDEIPHLIECIDSIKRKPKTGLRKRIYSFFKTKTFILKVAELLIAYLCMEYLNYLTKTTVQFQSIDFRLLFILLMGTVHGLKTGLAAAFLASYSCLIGYMNEGVDWRILVYNIDNWLPFAGYIITGTITGYTKDKNTNNLEFITDKHKDLEKRYEFLNDVYTSALSNKEQYKKQIISYRDSFGRILDFSKRLNTVMPDLIFKEALLSLEDILDNRTISIYSIESNGVFGRLNVCSKKIAETTSKSIDLKKFVLFKEKLSPGEVWSNTSRIIMYPDYVFPVFREDKLVLIVTIQKAEYDQLAMYFENLFKVVCSFIEESLLRAKDYNEKFEDEIYLPNSRILKNKELKEVLRVRAQMEEEAISEYSLISVDTTSDNIVEVANRMQKYLRESDIFGEGSDGKLYVILSQTNEEHIPFILERLKNAGILFNEVNTDLN